MADNATRIGCKVTVLLLKLFLCGDVMTGRGIDQILPHPGDPRLCEDHAKSAIRYVKLAEAANGPIPRPVPFDYVWGDVLAELDRAQVNARIINLETSITKNGMCWPKGINYRMSPQNVACLTAAQIDGCTLANNHVLDWGHASLVETIETLQSARIAVAGAGRNLTEAETPAIFNLGSKGRVIMFGFGSTSSGIPPEWAAASHRPGLDLLPDLSPAAVERIAARVRLVKRPGDVVLASIHWGENFGYRIPPEERDFAHDLIEVAGIDIVHGHSSHHAKAIEVYRGKLILYGCGDFLNDYEGIPGYEPFRNDLALMYLPSVEVAGGRLHGLSMVPFQIRNFRLKRAMHDDAEWLSATLTSEGARYGTRVERMADDMLELSW